MSPCHHGSSLDHNSEAGSVTGGQALGQLFQGLGLLIKRTENKSHTDLQKRQNNRIQSKSIAQIKD